MKKQLLRLAFLTLPLLGFGQTYFSDNFDDGNISDWTLYDQDGDGQKWETIALAAPVTPAIASYSYDNVTGSPLTPNNYIVSPAINLSAATTALLKYKVKAQDPSFPNETYAVYVATTNSVAAFLANGPLLTENSATNGPGGVFYSKSINLSAFVGQSQVYIAFRHYNSSNAFAIHIDDVIVVADLPVVPDCATLISPANAATNVEFLSATLKWSAATTGSTTDSYDVYLDKNPNPTTLVSNVNSTTFTAINLDPSTIYYWKIVAKNTVGSATGCSVNSFTTVVNPVAPYCGPVTYASHVEPITSVSFGGMTNTSPAQTSFANSHEVFLNKIANVNQGATLPITLKGNTDGPFTNNFVVFIDWNQDSDFADAGETYFGTIPLTITNSTGLDAVQAVGNILVPSDAKLGNTRMRVKKIFAFGLANYADPCAGGSATSSFGQTEDYTVNVAAFLGATDVNKNQISVYPNPVKDVLNITKSDARIIETSVYSIDGKLVKTIAGDQSSIRMSDLATGTYLVKVKTSSSEKSFKIIKK